MKEHFAQYLVDPIEKKSVRLVILAQTGGQVSDGLLINDHQWYPVINGVPRMLIGELKTTMLQSHHQFFRRWKSDLPPNVAADWQRALDQIQDFDRFLQHQKKTAETFAFEWREIYRENNYETNNFLHFTGPYFTPEVLHDKMVVDIGCGSGRFTKQAVVCGAKIAFGTDLGESVEVAYDLTKHMDQVCIVQADIYAMPFGPIFDYAYSIGVLHHLPKPQDGFSRLPAVLKAGGKMLIWVYNRRNNKRALYLYEPFRMVMKHIPRRTLYRLSYVPAALAEGLNAITKILQKVGAKKLAKQVPFSYYANFPFNMKLNDSFDVLATPKSNYYRVEEIRRWFADAGLQSIEAFEHPEAGITCVGTR